MTEDLELGRVRVVEGRYHMTFTVSHLRPNLYRIEHTPRDSYEFLLLDHDWVRFDGRLVIDEEGQLREAPAAERHRRPSDAAFTGLVERAGGSHALFEAVARERGLDSAAKEIGGDDWYETTLALLRVAGTVEVISSSPESASVVLGLKRAVTGESRVGVFELFPARISFLSRALHPEERVLAWGEELVDAALHGERERVTTLAASGAYLQVEPGTFVPRTVLGLGGADNEAQRELARLFVQLASRRLLDPESFVEWLDNHEMDRAADILRGYLADGRSEPVADVIVRLGQEIEASMPDPHDAPVRNVDGAIVSVPFGAVGRARDFIVFDLVGGYEKRAIVEVLNDEEEFEGVDYLRVRLDKPPPEGATAVWDADVWDDAEEIETITGTWDRFVAIRRILEETPVFLEQVRRTLLQAIALTTGPVCQAVDAVRVTEALGKAFRVYSEAADALRQGRPVVALRDVDRIAAVVADVALELATACAEGQRSLVATEIPTDLATAAAVTPDDADEEDDAA
ncbi:MAG: hypothetical protein R3A51_10505 [Nannocystaceae bacterium]